MVARERAFAESHEGADGPGTPTADRSIGARLEAWRAVHWPPARLRQVQDLAIYYGTREEVNAFAETLAEAMMVAADHVYEKCRGRIPRWMRIPKILHGVEGINLVQSTAKASRRFSSLTTLTEKCGEFPPETTCRVQAWLSSSPQAVVVAHRQFMDVRAYVFSTEQAEPYRVRFFQSGLVLAVTDNFVVQDHRDRIRRVRAIELQVEDRRQTRRKKRSDALRDELGCNDHWRLYARQVSV